MNRRSHSPADIAPRTVLSLEGARRPWRQHRGWLGSGRLLLGAACAAIGLLACSLLHARQAQARSGRTIRIHYYDPDANVRRVSRAKASLNKYLATLNRRVVFEPYARWSTFEASNRSMKPSFVVVSSLLYSRTGRLTTLKRLLVPAVRGATTYRKVVVTQSASITKLSDLHGKTFAVTARPSLTLLSPALVDRHRLRVVTVPKDMDALLAVSFRRVQGALVAQRSIDVLRRISAASVKKLRVLYRTVPISRPYFCSYGSVDAATVKLVRRAFVDMSRHRLGRQAMRMLGYDAWKGVATGSTKP